MSFRPEVLEIVQIAKESAYGSAAAANKQLYGLKLDIDPNIPTEVVTAQGAKGPVDVVVGKEQSMINITGDAALNDLLYLFSAGLEQATITTPGGGTTTRRWTFMPSDQDADTFESFTIEKGSSLGASRVTGVRLDEWDLTFVPDKSVALKGKAFGKNMVDGITMTATPTPVPLVNMSPRGVSVYMATSEAGLGAGQVKPLDFMAAMKNRHTGVFSLDASETSIEGTVERGIDITGQVTFPQSATTDGYMTELRASTKRFAQVIWTGDLIEGSLHYRMELTFPFKFRNPKRNPKQDVHCSVFDLQAVYDSAFGGRIKVVIDTIQTAL